MPRLAPRPAAEPRRREQGKKAKKPGGKKKKKKKAGDPDALDKRVHRHFLAWSAPSCSRVLGYIVWDQFIKPPSIVGTWRGSMTDYEIGSLITHNTV